MRTQDIIKKIAENMGVSYVFDNWTGANISLDDKHLPAIVYILPASGSLDFSKGWIKNNSNSMIAFLDKVDFQSNGDANISVVDKMLDLAKKFFVSLNQTGELKPVDGVLNYRTVYDTFDVNVSGIMFDVQLKEISGECERNIQLNNSIHLCH